ncbi:hypothetical protein [Gemmatimonas sp.]|uniref:hypothetical protein n=1 Tax=Gemmatimonas sp. TaxID=1962908 RepID=UPI0025BC6649|nr:hypothetical protein [Gemmatimonas sp.]MCA2982698.1 hypothetical protein [Gemmatimonas sp.]
MRLPAARPADTMMALAAGLLAAAPATVHAQRERAIVRAESFGGTTVQRPAGTVGRDSYTQQGVQVQLSHRVVREQGRSIVLLGGQWRGVQVALPQPSGAREPNTLTTLHVAAADLMLLRTVGERHTVVGVLRPGLYGESVRAEGALFVDRIVSPRTTVGAGLSYGSAYGKLLPIPVVHVLSRVSRRVLVDALLPARGDIWWMPRRGLDLGVNASLAGAQYGLSTAQQVAGANQLWLANATVGPQARWSPGGGKWQVTADAGFTVLRRLEYARDGRSVADLAPGNVPYARLGLQRLF